MAEVLLAERVGPYSFRRHVVLKRILPHLARKPEYVAMLLDEARITGGLNHVNIAQVFDVIEVHGSYFLVMEYLHGRNLSEIMSAARRKGGLPIECALAIAVRTAAGLHAAHECTDDSGEMLGIVHRDVSPSNVVVTFDGQVKVLDFGIALASSRTTQTESGVLKGKVAYMSPEQCRGAPLDRRADLYSLGVLLYEMLTLKKLRDGLSDFDNMQKIVAGELEPPSKRNPAVAPELDALVERALAVEPDDRFETCAAIADAIDDAADTIGAHLAPARHLAKLLKRLFGDVEPAWVNADEDSEPVEDTIEVSQELIAGLAPELAVGDAFEATSVTQLDNARAGRVSGRWLRPVIAGLAVAVLGGGFVALQMTGSHVLDGVTAAAIEPAPAPITSPDAGVVATKPISLIDAAPELVAVDAAEPAKPRARTRVRTRARKPREKKPAGSNAGSNWDPNSIYLPPDERESKPKP